MSKKLTEMGVDELHVYRQKWLGRSYLYQVGSKRWRKCRRRVTRAIRQLVG